MAGAPGRGPGRKAKNVIEKNWRSLIETKKDVELGADPTRTATIVAKTDMVCWGMTPWDFRPLVESNSTIAWKLLTAMADKLKA